MYYQYVELKAFSGTFCGQPAENRAYSGNTKSYIGNFLAKLVSHQKSTAEIRKVPFFGNHIHKICKGSEKIQSSLPFRLGSQIFRNWSEMPSKLALELLWKDVRALWTKSSEVEKQSIFVGPEQSKFPSPDVSA